MINVKSPLVLMMQNLSSILFFSQKSPSWLVISWPQLTRGHFLFSSEASQRVTGLQRPRWWLAGWYGLTEYIMSRGRAGGGLHCPTHLNPLRPLTPQYS